MDKLDKSQIRDYKTLALGFAGLLFLAQFMFMILAISKSFSPVPFWDTWNGGLDWFLNLNRDGIGSFFALHNEHRIPIERMLQLLDLSWFGGTGFFLVNINVLLLLTLQVLVFMGYRISSEARGIPPKLEIALLLFAVLGLSWIQKENIIWSFQSQFFLSYALPLATFISFSRSTDGSTRSKVLVIFLGSLSCYSMGNGLLVLPMILFFSILLRVSWIWISSYAIAILAIAMAYLSGSNSSGAFTSLFERPIDVLKFFLLLVGNPVVAFFGADAATGLVAVAFGAIFLGLVAYTFIVLYRQDARKTCSNPLFLFLVYVIGSMLLISVGRNTYGVEQAISSRYTTPVIFAYISLALLSSTCFRKDFISKAIILLFMVPSIVFQFRAATLFSPDQEERSLAGIATVLEVVDIEITDRIWPFENAKEIAKRAQAANVSIFSQRPWANLNEFIGSKENSNSQNCTLQILEMKPVDKSRNLVRAMGFISSSQLRNDGSVIQVSNDTGLGIGIGVLGAIQKSSEQTFQSESKNTFQFRGYFQEESLNSSNRQKLLCR